MEQCVFLEVSEYETPASTEPEIENIDTPASTEPEIENIDTPTESKSSTKCPSIIVEVETPQPSIEGDHTMDPRSGLLAIMSAYNSAGSSIHSDTSDTTEMFDNSVIDMEHITTPAEAVSTSASEVSTYRVIGSPKNRKKSILTRNNRQMRNNRQRKNDMQREPRRSTASRKGVKKTTTKRVVRAGGKTNSPARGKGTKSPVRKSPAKRNAAKPATKKTPAIVQRKTKVAVKGQRTKKKSEVVAISKRSKNIRKSSPTTRSQTKQNKQLEE